MTRTLVIGGGVSGLAAAWRLHQAGRDVQLYEASPSLGGVMQTRDIDGFLYEHGPNTVRSNSAQLMTWLEELGLVHAIVKSRPEADRRFIWKHAKLHVVPTGPWSFLTSGLLSVQGKLRLRSERHQPVPADPGDETLTTFFERRLGVEATESFVDPFVAGVFAGDPDQLGTDAFPQLRDMEKTYGSLLGALKVKREEAGGMKMGLMGLLGGWQCLPETVGDALGARVHLDHRLTRVRRDPRLTCTFETPTGTVEVTADEVVVALPAYGAAEVLESLYPAAAHRLAAIEHPHVAAVGLGYDRAAISHDLRGFGLLVPSRHPLPGAPWVLGVLFPSSIFPGRAPTGKASLVVMLGGTRAPEAGDASDQGLAEQAIAAVRRVLGASGRPETVSVIRHRRAIPQVTPGHAKRMAQVQADVQSMPGLVLAGNYLAGVSVEASVGSGFAAASRLLAGD